MLSALLYTEKFRICKAGVTDPIHVRSEHIGKIIPILIVDGVGDCWQAYVAAGLRRIPKVHALADPSQM